MADDTLSDQLFLLFSVPWFNCSSAHLKEKWIVDSYEDVPVNMGMLRLGEGYDCAHLAHYILGLRGFDNLHGIHRGVVTPKHDNRVFLFITKERHYGCNSFAGDFSGEELDIESFDEDTLELDNRIISSRNADDEVHLFYSNEGTSHFIYYGTVELISHEISPDKPTKFKFRTKRFEVIGQGSNRTDNSTHGDIGDLFQPDDKEING